MGFSVAMSKLTMALIATSSTFVMVQGVASTGYTRAWTSSNAAADGTGYLSSYADTSSTEIQDFVVQCSASCDASSGCVFFNVYQELSDQPPANICVLWSEEKPSNSATNTFNSGKPISNSSGFTKTATVTTPENYALDWSSPDAAADGSGYLSSFVSSQSVFYNDLVQECATACDASATCTFFNAYQEVQSSPSSNICVLWNQDKPSSSATNSFNSGRPISNSNGFARALSATTTTSTTEASTVSATTSAQTSTSTTIMTTTTEAAEPTDIPSVEYTKEWVSSEAAADGPGYISSFVSQTVRYAALVDECADSCTTTPGCVFFNVYQELSDQPPANICVLWNQNKPASSATNVFNNGRPISNSAGYSRLAISSSTTTSMESTSESSAEPTTTTEASTTSASVTATTSASTSTTESESTTTLSAESTSSMSTSTSSVDPSSTDPVIPTQFTSYLEQWTSDNAAADGFGYLSSFTQPGLLNEQIFYEECTDACDADSSCEFINTYVDRDSSGGSKTHVCVLWNQNKPESSATNIFNSDRPITNSVGYLKVINNPATSTTTTSSLDQTSSTEAATTSSTDTLTTSTSDPTTTTSASESTSTISTSSSTSTLAASSTASTISTGESSSTSSETSSTTSAAQSTTTSMSSTTTTSTTTTSTSTSESTSTTTTPSMTTMITSTTSATTSSTSTSSTSSQAPAPSVQSVVNPSFENATPAPWVLSSSNILVSSARPRTGSNGIVANVQLFNSVTLSQTLEGLVPGSTYTLRYWFQSTATSDTTASITVKADGTQLQFLLINTFIGQTYVEQVVTFTAGTAAPVLAFKVGSFEPTTVYIDDITVQSN